MSEVKIELYRHDLSKALNATMVQSQATSVSAYIKELPSDRQKTIRAMRRFMRKHMPKGYKECMNWGMICYEVPLKVFPDTYNKQPLMYCGLAAQKNHNAFYSMCAYSDEKALKKIQTAFKKAGKKCNMGKSCIRFTTIDDL